LKCNIHTFEVPRASTTFNITPYSDLHIGSTACDCIALKKHMDSRVGLHNPVFLNLGDVADLILPGDKRWASGVNLPDFYPQNKDDYLDWYIDQVYDVVSDYPWLLWCTGNHEEAVNTRRGVDVSARLYERLRVDNPGIIWGGYSGFLRLRFIFPYNKRGSCTESITIAYHHGAWGGMNRGLAAAKRWAAQMDGWRLMIYGHNHQILDAPECVMSMTDSGKLKERSRHVIVCGTWQSSYVDNRTTYSERKGYPPTLRSVPLITLKVMERFVKIRVTTGDNF
jgi:hypothetical protein